MTTESQDLGLTSHSKDCAFFWQYSAPITTGTLGTSQTTGWAPPAGLTNTSSSSNLVFPGGLPSRYWPGSTLLSFSGWPVLGYRVIWLLAIKHFISILTVGTQHLSWKVIFFFFHIVKVNGAGVVLNNSWNIFQNTFFYAPQRKRKFWNEMRLSKWWQTFHERASSE